VAASNADQILVVVEREEQKPLLSEHAGAAQRVKQVFLVILVLDDKNSARVNKSDLLLDDGAQRARTTTKQNAVKTFWSGANSTWLK
jgi:hypothetical protein